MECRTKLNRKAHEEQNKCERETYGHSRIDSPSLWRKTPGGMLAIAFIKRDKTALPSRLVCLCSGSSFLSAARVEKKRRALTVQNGRVAVGFYIPLSMTGSGIARPLRVIESHGDNRLPSQ